MMVDLEPTDEQLDALGLFASGVDMAINAGAGTGKTSTLAMLAEDRFGAAGRYVVFNRAAAADAQRRFPISVGCSTINSLAARATDRALLNRLEDKRRPSWLTAQHLGISRAMYLRVDGKERVLAPAWLAGHVMRALRTFCYSDDDDPAAKHFDHIPALDRPGERFNNWDVADQLVGFLNKAWADVLVPDGKLRFEHDHYVKAWALGRPQLPVDYLLVDEAQDLSPVQLDVFARQDCQVVWVGDAAQQIYEWRGAISALAHIETDCTTSLSQSFRFGQPIADLANDVLALLPLDLRLTGSARESMVAPLRDSPPAAVLCRTNACSVEEVLRFQRDDVKVHLVGGGGEVLQFAYAALKLKETGECDHRELGCFASWGAVQDYVRDDPLGGELKLLVNLVDEFGADTIIEALDDMVAEEQADVIVSTAHKAKGREWETVRLAPDFPEMADCGDEEFRLFYVAVTRARRVVDPYSSDLFRSLTTEEKSA